MVRALLDTNILIGYLLLPGSSSLPARLVEAAVEGAFTVLVIDPVLREIADHVETKPYLAARITGADIVALDLALRAVGEVVPALQTAIPSATRDPKDDYLIAYALAAAADVLVSGDQHLLALGQVGPVKIMAPRAFAASVGLPV